MATAAALSVKLFIDRKARRVLFAEASKEVVDFLFSLLALAVATAVKLLGKEDMVGSVGNLYASVEELHTTYVQPGAAKDALLRPTVPSTAAAASSSLLRLPATPSTGGQPKSYFKCSNTLGSSYGGGFYHSTSSCSTYVTDACGASCPNCGSQMTESAALQYVAPSSKQQARSATAREAKGFVQGIAAYTVLDNLTVTPMSTTSGITLLKTFAVRDLADLQEKTVQLGCDEGLAILKASLQSKTVLTDFFLGNKKAPAGRA